MGELMEGWIKLYRKMTEWQWYKNPVVRVVFEHLLLTANREDKYWNDILIRKGQVVTSCRHLASNTGLSVQQVRTAILKLKSTQDITYKSTNKYTLITIVNYDKYQSRR